MTKTTIRFKTKLIRPAERKKSDAWTFLILPKNASAKLPSRGMVGIAMCAWPLAIMLLMPRRWWTPMTGLGCAVILWVSILCSISF